MGSDFGPGRRARLRPAGRLFRCGASEFPGAPWGSTPQAVLDALDLQDSQILYNEETTSEASPEEASADERTWVLIAQDLDYLGATSHYAKFTFNQYDGEEQFGLYDVQLCFP